LSGLSSRLLSSDWHSGGGEPRRKSNATKNEPNGRGEKFSLESKHNDLPAKKKMKRRGKEQKEGREVKRTMDVS